MKVIGIDCGLSGAVAMLGEGGLERLEDLPIALKGKGGGSVKNEINPAELNSMLKAWVNGSADSVLVVVERVNAMPDQGVSSVFSLGDTQGCIRGVLAARGYPVEWISPQRWKRRFGLIATDKDVDKKELSRAKAIQLYPEADLARKKDHNRGDAILIARFGWEVFR